GAAQPAGPGGGAATSPPRSTPQAPSKPAPGRQSTPDPSTPGKAVLTLPKRIITQAGLSVGSVPLVLLILVILIGLGLVIVGTRRRASDERRLR
ncbi:MAG TPA: hypothetical protein VGX49_16210, partial [Jatrophihabitans sp.]|nr:hypothetical protein [Jatrophihabitans sp.]